MSFSNGPESTPKPRRGAKRRNSATISPAPATGTGTGPVRVNSTILREVDDGQQTTMPYSYNVETGMGSDAVSTSRVGNYESVAGIFPARSPDAQHTVIIGNARQAVESAFKESQYWLARRMQMQGSEASMSYTSSAASSSVASVQLELLKLHSKGTMTAANPGHSRNNEQETQTESFPFVQAISLLPEAGLIKDEKHTQTILDHKSLGLLLEQVNLFNRNNRHHLHHHHHGGGREEAIPIPVDYNDVAQQLLRYQLQHHESQQQLKSQLGFQHATQSNNVQPLNVNPSGKNSVAFLYGPLHDMRDLIPVHIDLDPTIHNEDDTLSPTSSSPRAGPSGFKPMSLQPQMSLLFPEKSNSFSQPVKPVKHRLSSGPPSPGPQLPRTFCGSAGSSNYHFPNNPQHVSVRGINHRTLMPAYFNHYNSGSNINQQVRRNGVGLIEQNDFISLSSRNIQHHHSSPGITIIANAAELHSISDQLVPVNIDLNLTASTTNTIKVATIGNRIYNHLDFPEDDEDFDYYEPEDFEEESKQKYSETYLARSQKYYQMFATLAPHQINVDEGITGSGSSDENPEDSTGADDEDSPSEEEYSDSDSGYSADDEESSSSSSSDGSDNDNHAQEEIGGVSERRTGDTASTRDNPERIGFVHRSISNPNYVPVPAKRQHHHHHIHRTQDNTSDSEEEGASVPIAGTSRRPNQQDPVAATVRTVIKITTNSQRPNGAGQTAYAHELRRKKLKAKRLHEI